jgi:hypothetical protein
MNSMQSELKTSSMVISPSYGPQLHFKHISSHAILIGNSFTLKAMADHGTDPKHI